MIIIKLWDIRKERQITLAQLAEMTGISKSTLNNIENGKYSPTLDNLEKIADSLDVNLADLYECAKDI